METSKPADGFISPFVTFANLPTDLHGNSYSPSTAVGIPVADRAALDWLFGPKLSAPSLSERVLASLIQSEAHERNPHLRDDLRIAQLIVIHCERGDAVECSPEVLATYEVLGCHPNQVHSRILARREAMLGPAGAEATPLSVQSAPVPKKPSQSIQGNEEVQHA